MRDLVSGERLEELISSDIAWRDESGELDSEERRWYDNRIAALTELREMRKVLGALEETARRDSVMIMQSCPNPEEWSIGVDHDQTCCPSRTFFGDSLLSALAALVERGEA